MERTFIFIWRAASWIRSPSHEKIHRRKEGGGEKKFNDGSWASFLWRRLLVSDKMPPLGRRKNDFASTTRASRWIRFGRERPESLLFIQDAVGIRNSRRPPPSPPNIESHLQAASALFFFSPLSGDLLFQFFRLFINSCSSTILGEFLPASFDVTIKKSRKSPRSFSMPPTTWNVEGNFYFFGGALFTNWNIGARTRSRVGNVRTAPNSICLK